MLRGASGGAPTRPETVAGAVRELASRADVPVRLLLGADAVRYAGAAAAAQAESDEEWREFSASVSG